MLGLGDILQDVVRWTLLVLCRGLRRAGPPPATAVQLPQLQGRGFGTCCEERVRGGLRQLACETSEEPR